MKYEGQATSHQYLAHQFQIYRLIHSYANLPVYMYMPCSWQVVLFQISSSLSLCWSFIKYISFASSNLAGAFTQPNLLKTRHNRKFDCHL